MADAKSPSPSSGASGTGPLFTDGGLFGLDCSVEDAHVVVVPVPFEATVSYGAGCADAPAAILAASRQVDLYCVQTGRPDKAGIAMLEPSADVRSWSDEARGLAEMAVRGESDDTPAPNDPGLKRINELCHNMNEWVREQCDRYLDQGKVVVTLGGDHSVAYGAIAAHAARTPGMGVLHIDAHFDLRHAYEGFAWSHASVIHNAYHDCENVKRFVHVGVRDFSEEEYKFASGSHGRSLAYLDQIVHDRLATGEPWRDIVREMVKRLPRKVYVTFDIDGLDPSLCPGTGTPVPGGLSFHMAVSLLDAIIASGRQIVGADLCEVAPAAGDQEWNANVGARVLYKLIGFILKHR